MKYWLLGNEWKENEPVKIEVKITPKTFTIKPISPKPFYTNGCIDQLWDKGKIIISKPKHEHKICRHMLINWDNGKYTLYPDRAGLPYKLVPKENGFFGDEE
jgi:hypothetical protein